MGSYSLINHYSVVHIKEDGEGEYCILFVRVLCKYPSCRTFPIQPRGWHSLLCGSNLSASSAPVRAVPRDTPHPLSLSPHSWLNTHTFSLSFSLSSSEVHCCQHLEFHHIERYQHDFFPNIGPSTGLIPLPELM